MRKPPPADPGKKNRNGKDERYRERKKDALARARRKPDPLTEDAIHNGLTIGTAEHLIRNPRYRTTPPMLPEPKE